MQERARDLFLAGARAFAELMDVEQRNTLLFRRRTLREERARRPAASFAIKTDLLDAESQYKKGKALLDGEKYREALMLLEFAADCDPQNGLYAAELAWCRFLASSANAGRALKELAETLRRDPNCGLAAYYAGEIERQAGDPVAAEAHLRRASKLMSPDRRPIEALKALAGERRR
jgi:tetratricopeptide (TPR) repeat protein